MRSCTLIFTVLTVCVVAVLRAEVGFPVDVQLAAVAKGNDGITYVAGQTAGQGYVARVASPNGPLVEIPLQMPEADSSRLTAIAVGNDGSLYVAGNAVTGQRSVAFAQKYEASGGRQYSIRLGGEAATTAHSIAVNALGEALINGEVLGGGFLTTPGAPNADPVGSLRTGFVVKLDGNGNVMVAARGVGVGAAVYGPEASIYT